MKVLLASFEPFGEDRINSAWEAIKSIPETIDGTQVTCCQMKTERYVCLDPIQDNLANNRFDAVVAFGMAKGSPEISIEKSAINLDNFRIPDNGGNQPKMASILPDKEDGLFSTLPVGAMKNAVQAKGIPSIISFNAGTFICNHLFYLLQSLTKYKYPTVKSGFVHIPAFPDMVVGNRHMASMSQAECEAAVLAIVKTLGKPEEMVKGQDGTIY